MMFEQPSAYSHFGRLPIYSDVDEVTPDNVVKVLNDTISVFNTNRGDIAYLWGVYRGNQDVLYRTKDTRPEIQNNVVVNRANEIVSFKSSYLLGEPMQYVSSASAGSDAVERLATLNEFMRLEGKPAKDMELADWIHICGVGYRLVLPDSRTRDPHGSPFNIYVLDPRDTFVIRHSGVGQYPLAGVHIVHRVDEPDLYCVYTRDWYMEIPLMLAGTMPPPVKAERVTYPEVPIVEYVHNKARMGAFEVVLSILNAINTIESNRVDAIEQFVQSIWVFENCDIDDEKFAEMRAGGAVKIKSSGSLTSKVYQVGEELQQDGVQKVVDDLYAAMLDICGMPSTQSGGASTSDTGAAVIMRDGWQQAEARAKETEHYFAESEQQFLVNVLEICRNVRGLDIGINEIRQQFTRRNYADLLTKSQVLTTMLQSGKIAPKLCFESCGMFVDSEAAYLMSLPYIEKAEALAQKALDTPTPDAPNEGGSRGGQPGDNGGSDNQ